MMINQVKKIIADVCHIGETDVVADRDLTSYGMDSARAMDLVVTLEDTFHVEISDELIIRLRSANDIVEALEGLVTC